MLKGMSAVIAVVLILLITISLAAAGYLFFGSIMSSTTESASQSISQITTTITQDFNIESVRGEKIYIRNTGQGTLSGFSVYIDDRFVNATDVSIPPGEVRNITLYDFIDYSRPRTLKVTTAGTMKTMTVGPANQYPDLVGYWKLDESSGNITDYSGMGNTGVPASDVKYGAPGKINTGLEFNGTQNSYVNIGNPDSVKFAYDDFSILLWVKNNNYIPDSWEDTYVGKVNTTSPRTGYAIAIRGSEDPGNRAGMGYAYICLYTTSCSYVVFTQTLINDSTWHHLAFTVDRQGNATLYLDGVWQGARDISSKSLLNETNNIPLYIGGSYSSDVYRTNGTLDEIQLWRRALTPEEVWNQYAHGPI